MSVIRAYQAMRYCLIGIVGSFYCLGIVIYSDMIPAAIPVERIRPTVAAPDGRSLYLLSVDHTGRDPR